VSQTPLLQIRDLKTYFATEAGKAKAVDGVSFDIYPGEVLGLVGESGSGKSVTALSILRLIPDPPGKIVGGSILYKGSDLLKLTWDQMRRDIRGNEISMIFQEPMTSLNPVFTIGMQIMEVLFEHEKVSKKEAFDRSVEMLELVGIPDPASRMNDYPHQFSGGMRQRVMIAMALACNPSLLIADEPTTALDVTIQAQILELMLKIKDARKDAAILLITHNLAVVAETCHRVMVMYGGKLQEVAPVRDLFKNPLHPYTRGLLASLPTVDGDKHSRLRTIPGNVPSILELPPACKFVTRCPERFEPCDKVEPELIENPKGHWVRCHLVNPIEPSPGLAGPPSPAGRGTF
jgi:oligopeptide/dipeptide ABC transporter ATP-binding protein